MNKQKLAQYQALQKEIRDLELKLRQYQRREVADKVQASNSEFPYQPMELRISGLEQDSKYEKKIYRLLKDRYIRCQAIQLQIEEFISKIDDSRVRIIFQKRYINNWSWRKISMYLGSQSESYARKIHDRYLT